MKNVLLTLSVFLLTEQASAQWAQLTSNTTNNQQAVSFVDGYTGYTSGASGTILKTTDKGGSWSNITSGTTANLVDVHFPEDELTGFVIANSGLIRKTTDGGANWNALSSGTTDNLRGLYFLNNDTGFFCGQGGTIGKTEDGGASWSLQSVSAYYMRDMHFSSIDTGYTCGDNGLIFKTVDGGSGWVSQATGTTENLQAIHFPVKDTGYASGLNGTLLKTTDGGSNWTITSVPISETLRVFFITSEKGYIIGNAGSIYYTTDGGSNWVSQSSGGTDGLLDICFPNPGIGYISGENGVLLKAEFSPSAAITSGSNLNCKSVCDGSATVTASGGAESYGYVWSDANFQTTATATGLCAETYTVTVTDINGNTATDNFTLTEPSELTASISISAASGCDNQLTVSATGGTSGYTYQWNDPDGQTDLTATGLCNGNYCVTVTDNNNCKVESCMEINTFVEDKIRDERITIFPNPSAGQLRIKTGENYQITSVKIMDISGHHTYTDLYQVGHNVYHIDLEDYSKGVYILQIISDENIINKRLIIQ